MKFIITNDKTRSYMKPKQIGDRRYFSTIDAINTNWWREQWNASQVGFDFGIPQRVYDEVHHYQQ